MQFMLWDVVRVERLDFDRLFLLTPAPADAPGSFVWWDWWELEDVHLCFWRAIWEMSSPRRCLGFDSCMKLHLLECVLVWTAVGSRSETNSWCINTWDDLRTWRWSGNVWHQLTSEKGWKRLVRICWWGPATRRKNCPRIGWTESTPHRGQSCNRCCNMGFLLIPSCGMPFICPSFQSPLDAMWKSCCSTVFHCVPLCSTCHKELKRQSEEYRPTFRQGDAGRTHEDSDVGRQAHVAIVATVVSNW